MKNLYFLALSVILISRLSSEYVSFPSIGKQYKFHNAPMNWDLALLICWTEDAELAYLTSDDEIPILVNLFKNYGSFFMGFHDKFMQGNYVDLKGNNIYVPEDSNFLINKNNGRCGGMTYLGEIETYSCSENKRFICQKKIMQLDVIKTIDNFDLMKSKLLMSNCSLNAINRTPVFYNIEHNRRYRLHLTIRDQKDAIKACIKENSWLAVINSQEEANLLVNAVSLYPEQLIAGTFDKSYVLVGLTDLIFQGTFTTYQGDRAAETGYSSWAEGHPNKSLHCGGMHRNGELISVSCDSPAMFFCEKKLQP